MKTPAAPDRLRPVATWPGIGSVLLGVAGITALAAVATFARRYGFADLSVHLETVRSWLAGDDLYAQRTGDGRVGLPQPPVAALLAVPAVMLPLPVAGALLAMAGVAALVPALVVLVGPTVRRGWGFVAGATVLALVTEPVRRTLGLGHLDVLIFGLVVADLAALRRAAGRDRWWPPRGAPAAGAYTPMPAALRRGWADGAWAGVGIGLATAIGIGPVLFIAYLAVTRQWRAAVMATGTAVTAAVVAFLVAPAATLAWCTDVGWHTDRTGPIDSTGNQSLAGLLARLYDAPTTPLLLWLAFSMLLVTVGLVRACGAHDDGDEIAAFTLVGLTGHIVGPVSPTSGLLWLLPAVFLLADTALRRRGAGRPRLAGAGHAVAAGTGYLLLVAAPIWTYQHRLPHTSHYADGIGGMILENAYGWALIALVVALPWRPGAASAVRARPRPVVRRPIPPARRPTS